MGSLFGSPKVPPIPKTPTPGNSPEIAQAAADAARRGANAKGRSSTILGGSLGEDNVQSKSLLGR